jgi:hypothetical protein
MTKSQNRSTENRRSQGNMTPQKSNNHTIEALVEVKGMKPQFPSSKE